MGISKTPPPQPEEVIPLYVTEEHLYSRDADKIKEELKQNPVIFKLVWHKIITLIKSQVKDEDAPKVIAQLQAYVALLPESESKKQVQPPTPNKI